MKIVGFEANGGLHLGVVEGDQVIDLQAVDAAIPGDLAEVLRRNNGDLTPLKDAAKRRARARAVRSPGSNTPCRWPGPARSSASA